MTGNDAAARSDHSVGRGASVAASARGGLARYLAGPDLAEAFLLAAVVAVLAIRGFLAVTGYPQVGGSRLHVAHMLWGGLGMLAALLSLLLFLGSRVRIAAAWIGGLGFGTFIDELGKFLTRDNDYFFRPAVALIYLVFVGVFVLVRYISGRRSPSRAERLGYAYSALTDVALGSLDNRRRQRALELLDGEDELVRDVRDLLARAPAPTRPPSRWARLNQLTVALTDRLYALAAHPRMRQAVIAVFFLLAGGLIAAILIAVVLRGGPGTQLNVLSIGSGLSVLAVGLCSLLGVAQLLRGARVAALALFYRATLLALFFGQFFAFIAVQFVALAGLAVNLIVLVALRVELAAETAG